MEKTIECPHDQRVLRVIERTVTCEKTAEFCTKCNKQLSEPKTEC